MRAGASTTILTAMPSHSKATQEGGFLLTQPDALLPSRLAASLHLRALRFFLPAFSPWFIADSWKWRDGGDPCTLGGGAPPNYQPARSKGASGTSDHSSCPCLPLALPVCPRQNFLSHAFARVAACRSCLWIFWASQSPLHTIDLGHTPQNPPRPSF